MELLISDIETLKAYSLFSFKVPGEEKWYEFSINKYENDLYSFVKFMEGNRDKYIIFYNGLRFDGQVIEFILRNYTNWLEKTNLEICFLIWQFAQDVIILTNNDLYPPYREENFKFKVIDVMEIPHFTNENRRTSLKWLEFMMDMENIEEMPYLHDKEDFTKDEIFEIKHYCRNDIYSTEKWYNYLIGNTEHKFYKGENNIEYRLNLIEEGILPEKAISYSNSKIGDEINKYTYCKLTGTKYKDLSLLRRKKTKTKKFTFGDAIPDYIQFQTPELQEFYNRIKKVKVSLAQTDKQEFPVIFRGTQYNIARGGIHSTEKNRLIIPKEGELLRDADVGAQYSNGIKKRGLFVKHLGIEWNTVGTKNIEKKDYYKQQGKGKVTDTQKSKFKGLEKMYKLALNAGYFGKTNDRTNWQYDPIVTFHCTIGNEFEILMLIEMLELEGIHCISANTDGIVCLFPKDLDERYYVTCHEWEAIVGNTVMGKLEYSDMSKLWQESVNHYIAIGTDGKEKVKGRFLEEDELNKNNSDKIGRVERIAIVEWVKNSTPPEETIMGCNNIFKFCMGLKSSRNYHFQTIDKNSNVEDYKKVIRFFVSNKGPKLIKIKNENSEATGADISRISDGYFVTMFNRAYFPSNFDSYNINYSFYIDKTKEIIEKVEGGRKNKKYKPAPKEQTSLF